MGADKDHHYRPDDTKTHLPCGAGAKNDSPAGLTHKNILDCLDFCRPREKYRGW